jgi:CheY-like chemotaxis protein
VSQKSSFSSVSPGEFRATPGIRDSSRRNEAPYLRLLEGRRALRPLRYGNMQAAEIQSQPEGAQARGHDRVPRLRDRGEPTVLILSGDDSLLRLAQRAVPAPRHIKLYANPNFTPRLLAKTNVRLVVIDDQSVMPSDRAWLLNQVRRRCPDVLVIYIAARHDTNREKHARTNGANFYMSKPVDSELFMQVLRAFLRFAG